MSKLTPISRALISATVAVCLFLGIKNVIYPNLKGLGFNGSNTAVLLTLNGTSTLGQTMTLISKKFMETELKGTNVTIQKINEAEIDVVGDIDNVKKRIVIMLTGSLDGVEAVRNRRADLGLLTGIPENITDDIHTYLFALDGLALLVSKSNPIESLTKAQIKAIFLGEITNWSEVGGTDMPINIRIRDPKQATTFETFKQLVDEPMATLASSAVRYKDAQQMLQDIANDPQAIGLYSSTDVGTTKVLSLSDEGTAALYPSVFTIKTEEYLFTRRLFLASLTSEKNELTSRFIEFCTHDDKGQTIVAESGFVNLSLNNAAGGNNVSKKNAPPQYLAATNGAERLPTSLHFQSGSSIPDERATDDIQRIITILSKSQNAQKEVRLIGFTDNVGNPNLNLDLSIRRTQSIQNVLIKFGVKSEIYGFGQALPIATNATLLGQNKNRRVEVWLK